MHTRRLTTHPPHHTIISHAYWHPKLKIPHAHFSLKTQPLCVGINLESWPPVQDPRRLSRGLTHMQSRALGALCRAGAGPQLPSRSGRIRELQPLDYHLETTE